jgi:hypothetical protein
MNEREAIEEPAGEKAPAEEGYEAAEGTGLAPDAGEEPGEDAEDAGEEASEEEGFTDTLEGDRQLDTTPSLAEHMPELETRVIISSKARLLPGKVMLGRKKTFKVEIVIPYDGEKVRAINDLVGGYVDLQLIREVYKDPQSAAEEEALKQYWLDFGQEVGA